MGNRTPARNPVSQQQSYGMNVGDKDDAMSAFAAARLIARAGIAQPGKEVAQGKGESLTSKGAISPGLLRHFCAPRLGTISR
jgi:hypothetical protein